MIPGPAFAVPVGDDAAGHHRRLCERFRTHGFKNHPMDTVAERRRLRANYYGLVTMVDNAYGRVLRALEQSGQADNTIVVYTSDHGEMSGDHCLMTKGVFYEPAVHVPLFIHVPWLSRQRRDLAGPLSLIDLVPTLLDLLQDGVPAGLDGVSRAGALRDPSSWRQEDVVVEWNDADFPDESGRSLVAADGWKLNLYRNDIPELYDLNGDPGELRNRAADPGQRDRVRRMAAAIRAWQQRHHDTLPLTV